LVLAVLAAAAVIKILAPTGFPQALLTAAAFVVPAALPAIWLAEARRVRGILYWAFIGALIGALGYWMLAGGATTPAETARALQHLTAVTGVGLLGGLLYWWAAGKNSGDIAAAAERAGRVTHLDENGLRRRCRACTALTLLLGILPLALIGWQMVDRPQVPLPVTIAANAQSASSKLLADAGLPWAGLAIENHIGRVTGIAPDANTRTESFAKAKTVLAPMVGLPGVVAYLQNDIAIAEPVALAAPVPNRGAAEQERLATEAKRKADEEAAETAKALALEQERLAADAKRKADEEAAAAATAAARARALEDERLAAEAKRKAEEEAAAAAKARADEAERVAAEAKRKADEEAAVAAAARAREEADAARLREEERLAADAKRKADEEAAAAAAAAARARALEDERLAAEAKRKAEDDSRLALEAERERNAVAAAHKAEADKAGDASASASKDSVDTVPSSGPGKPDDSKCDGEFAQLFKTKEIQFPLNGVTLSADLDAFLDAVTELSKRCEHYSIDVAGHADRTGRNAANLGTSLARAVAVRDALAARGISQDRLRAKGYGDSRPLNPARTRAAFKLNRRVELSASRMALVSQAPDSAVEARAKVKPLQLASCHRRLNNAMSRTRIRFARSASTPRHNTAPALARIARLLLRCSSHHLTINGHADMRGTIEANQKLSERRAGDIRDLLMKRGAPAEQLLAVGHGGLLPIAHGRTKADYARNRRVDFDISVAAPPRQ